MGAHGKEHINVQANFICQWAGRIEDRCWYYSRLQYKGWTDRVTAIGNCGLQDGDYFEVVTPKQDSSLVVRCKDKFLRQLLLSTTNGKRNLINICNVLRRNLLFLNNSMELVKECGDGRPVEVGSTLRVKHIAMRDTQLSLVSLSTPCCPVLPRLAARELGCALCQKCFIPWDTGCAAQSTPTNDCLLLSRSEQSKRLVLVLPCCCLCQVAIAQRLGCDKPTGIAFRNAVEVDHKPIFLDSQAFVHGFLKLPVTPFNLLRSELSALSLDIVAHVGRSGAMCRRTDVDEKRRIGASALAAISTRWTGDSLITFHKQDLPTLTAAMPSITQRAVAWLIKRGPEALINELLGVAKTCWHSAALALCQYHSLPLGYQAKQQKSISSVDCKRQLLLKSFVRTRNIRLMGVTALWWSLRGHGAPVEYGTCCQMSCQNLISQDFKVCQVSKSVRIENPT